MNTARRRTLRVNFALVFPPDWTPGQIEAWAAAQQVDGYTIDGSTVSLHATREANRG